MKKSLLALLAATSGIALFANPGNTGQDNLQTEEINSICNEFIEKATPKERYYSIIDENRIWEYYVERRRCVMDADNDSYAKIVRMQFKGTTEINGKEYHNLVVTYGYHTTMPYIHPFDGYDPAYDVEYKFEGEETIAYMREEGPRCYMLLHKGDSEESETVWKILRSCYGSEENEYLIYDFSLFVGGVINQFSGLDDEAIAVEKERRSAPYLYYQNQEWWNFEWWENFIYGMYGAYVDHDPYPSPDLTDMENYNNIRLMQQTHRGDYLEGVGSLSSYLPFPGTLSGSLNNLYDLEGNILYIGLNKELDLDNPKSVSAEKRMEDSDRPDIYSINGQLVRRNAESTDGLEKGIYIFRGKKVLVR